MNILRRNGMKRLLLIILTLALICLSAVSCDKLPDEVKDILGIVVEIPEDDTPDAAGNNESEDTPGIIPVHKYETSVTEPTCYEEGYTTYTCECGKEYVDTSATVAPLGHKNVKHDAKYPTCTENGWNEYTVCERCGYSTFEETYATGHFTIEELFYEIFEREDGSLYVEAICLLCDQLADVTIDPYGLAVTKENKSELGISEYFPTVPTVYHVGDEWYVIRSISDGAFKDCMNYTEIALPSTLTTISESAFEGCVQLASVDIPEGVTHIYASAFKNCGSLVTVNLPTTLEFIGEGAFLNCSKLRNITLNNGLLTIDSKAFMNCSKLTKINIPDTVTTIGVSAFDGSSISTIIGGKGLRVITTDAFKNCAKLTTFFYTGTKDEYEAITIAPGNDKLSSIPIFYYSETKANGCWRYNDSGSPQPW